MIVSDASQWSSFHIYMGEYLDRAEGVVREALPAIAGDAEWFFLYFTDELGPHLRLRVRAGARDPDAIEDDLHQVVAELPEREKAIGGPLVTIAGMSRPSPGGRVGVRAVAYPRDLQKYRTDAIATLAEASFVASTRLVVGILANERAGRFAKKSAAPALLWELVRHLPEDRRAHFLDTCADFALGAADAAALKPNFTQAGRSARERALPVLVERARMPASIAADLDAWSASLGLLLAAAGDDAAFRSLLLMDAAHLCNNRLGFNFVDEAYLALLVAGQLDEPCHAQ